MAKIKGGTVRLQSNQVYKLNRQGVKTFKRLNDTMYSYGYCIELPSNVTLDLNGSTLFVNNNQDASVIINEHPDCSGEWNKYNDTNISIINGILDQNMNNQSNMYWQSGIYLASVKSFRVEHLRILNSNMCGFKLDKVDTGFIDNVFISNTRGHGCYWGNKDRYDLLVRNLTVGHLLIEHCRDVYSFPQMASGTLADGNSLHFAGQNCTFKYLVEKDTDKGVKISNHCKHINFEYIYTEKSGFKFQDHGTKDTRPKYININTIDMYNCIDGSFRIETAEHITVNTVNMYNCVANTYRLVWIAGENININSINIINCKGSQGVLFRSDAFNINIKHFTINSNINCELSKNSIVNIETLTLKRDNIELSDSEEWERGFNNVGSYCVINTVYIYGDNERYKYNQPITTAMVDEIGCYVINDVCFNGTSLNGKVITLTSGTNSSITDKRVYKQDYGHYSHLYPILSLIPLNSKSRQINITNIKPNNGSITVNHSQATGDEKFIVRVDKYISSTDAIN